MLVNFVYTRREALPNYVKSTVVDSFDFLPSFQNYKHYLIFQKKWNFKIFMRSISVLTVVYIFWWEMLTKNSFLLFFKDITFAIKIIP
jgi:hypothetical protein